MSEFWLISAPGDKTNLQAWERMNTVTSKSNLSSNSKFHIPDLKVGTLDALVGLSDELGKLDTFAEREVECFSMSTWGNVVLSKADVPIRHSYLSTLQIPRLQGIVQRLETAGFCCPQLSVPQWE